MRLAVCGLLLRPNLVLASQRPDGTWGLPGGKIDPEDKTPEAAVIREVWEETGLFIVKPMPVFARRSSAISEFLTTTYAAVIHMDPNGPNMKPGRAGERPCAWVPRRVITEGQYGEYNTEMFEFLRIPY